MLIMYTGVVTGRCWTLISVEVYEIHIRAKTVNSLLLVITCVCFLIEKQD